MHDTRGAKEDTEKSKEKETKERDTEKGKKEKETKEDTEKSKKEKETKERDTEKSKKQAGAGPHRDVVRPGRSRSRQRRNVSQTVLLLHIQNILVKMNIGKESDLILETVIFRALVYGTETLNSSSITRLISCGLVYTTDGGKTCEFAYPPEFMRPELYTRMMSVPELFEFNAGIGCELAFFTKVLEVPLVAHCFGNGPQPIVNINRAAGSDLELQCKMSHLQPAHGVVPDLTAIKDTSTSSEPCSNRLSYSNGH